MSKSLEAPPGDLKVDIELAVELNSGEVLHLDYRPNALKTSAYQVPSPDSIRPLKVVQWNIERGIELERIIDDLRAIDADIIALQEVDCGLSRSEYLDTGIAIARELGLNYVFQCEFIELEGDIDKKYFYDQIISKASTTNQKDNQPLFSSIISRNDSFYQSHYKRHPSQISTTSKSLNADQKPHNAQIQYHPTPIFKSSSRYSQYGVQSDKSGVHGNAILTKFDISKILPLAHKHRPYDWEKDGILLNEPRIGSRATLCAVVDVPSFFVATQCKQSQSQSQQPTNSSIPSTSPTLYTLNSSKSQSRVQVPVYTCHMELFCGTVDRLKIYAEIMAHFRSTFLLQSSTESLTTKPFCNAMVLGDFNTLAHSIARFSKKYCKDVLRYRNLGHTEAEWWYRFVLSQYSEEYLKEHPNMFAKPPKLEDFLLPNLTPEDCQAIENPGFEETFPANTETLTNYSGWFYGKLDWMLTMNCLVTNHDLFNTDYLSSDHRGMIIDCFLKEDPTLNIKEIDCVVDQTQVPVIPSKFSHLFNNSQYLLVPSSSSSPTTQNKPTFPFSSQVTISNSPFTMVPGLRNQLQDYYHHNQGLSGYCNRNITPFVSQMIVFVIPTILAFIYVLFFSGFAGVQ